MSRYRSSSAVSLFVRNVADDVSPQILRELFEKYGRVKDVYIPLDHFTHMPRGFAYVQIEDYRDAEDAMYELHRYRIHGQELSVEFAQGDRKTPSQMRNKERRMAYPSGGRDDYRADRRPDRNYEKRSRRYSRSYSRDSRGKRRSHSRSISNSPSRYHGRRSRSFYENGRSRS